MKSYFARSAKPEQNIPSQSYLEHVFRVLVRGRSYLLKAMSFTPNWDVASMRRILELAAEFHDLGKLCCENQEILSGEKTSNHLPINHVDAGVAHLMSENENNFWSAWLIYAHHIGLSNYSDEDHFLRDAKIAAVVDSELPKLLERHNESVRPSIFPKTGLPEYVHVLPADLRLLYSCLTHADHGDAARSQNEEPRFIKTPKLRAKERLDSLKNYISTLPNDGSERNEMRASFFTECANGSKKGSIAICDAPVGTGKTTSLMASLLNTAEREGLRRIFVILPFTNIIVDSVATYRKALTLEGENPNEVVAEIHHKADFSEGLSRKLTALWDAPIIVTTAVAFFETLASASSSTLRRLQNLPGSAIFLDESHAMLPVKLLPLAWHWIQFAAQNWSCHWILGSGSLCHFWELEEFQMENSITQLPNLLTKEQQMKLNDFEIARVEHCRYSESMYLPEFAEWLSALDGPIIVVVNTVQTAAATAKAAQKTFGVENVIHLSTALTPNDVEKTIKTIKRRLKDKSDSNWCLIATSCVEAGMDFSFKTGVRECASLLSLLQLAGRVNRNAEYDDSVVWTVALNANDDQITINPSVEKSANILWKYFDAGIEISPALCTESMLKEVRELNNVHKELCIAEEAYQFKDVENQFKVINDNSNTVVIDPEIINKIKNGGDFSWQELQKASVRIRPKNCEKLDIQESKRFPGIYLWPEGHAYSSFIGYMEAILAQNDFMSQDCWEI